VRSGVILGALLTVLGIGYLLAMLSGSSPFNSWKGIIGVGYLAVGIAYSISATALRRSQRARLDRPRAGA